MIASLQKESIRFLVVGAINTGATYLEYLALLNWLSYPVAYSIAFATGILLSFYLNTRFVFRTPASWRKLLLYPGVYVVQYLLGVFVLWIAVEHAGLSRPTAMLVVIVVSTPVTFILSRSILRVRRDGDRPSVSIQK